MKRTQSWSDTLQTSASSWTDQSPMTVTTCKGACDGGSQAERGAVTVIKLWNPLLSGLCALNSYPRNAMWTQTPFLHLILTLAHFRWSLNVAEIKSNFKTGKALTTQIRANPFWCVYLNVMCCALQYSTAGLNSIFTNWISTWSSSFSAHYRLWNKFITQGTKGLMWAPIDFKWKYTMNFIFLYV